MIIQNLAEAKKELRKHYRLYSDVTYKEGVEHGIRVIEQAETEMLQTMEKEIGDCNEDRPKTIPLDGIYYAGRADGIEWVKLFLIGKITGENK